MNNNNDILYMNNNDIRKLTPTKVQLEIKKELNEKIDKNEEIKKSPNNEYSTIGRFKIYTIHSSS